MRKFRTGGRTDFAVGLEWSYVLADDKPSSVLKEIAAGKQIFQYVTTKKDEGEGRYIAYTHDPIAEGLIPGAIAVSASIVDGALLARIGASEYWICVARHGFPVIGFERVISEFELQEALANIEVALREMQVDARRVFVGQDLDGYFERAGYEIATELESLLGEIDSRIGVLKKYQSRRTIALLVSILLVSTAGLYWIADDAGLLSGAQELAAESQGGPTEAELARQQDEKRRALLSKEEKMHACNQTRRGDALPLAFQLETAIQRYARFSGGWRLKAVDLHVVDNTSAVTYERHTSGLTALIRTLNVDPSMIDITKDGKVAVARMPAELSLGDCGEDDLSIPVNAGVTEQSIRDAFAAIPDAKWELGDLDNTRFAAIEPALNGQDSRTNLTSGIRHRAFKLVFSSAWRAKAGMTDLTKVARITIRSVLYSANSNTVEISGVIYE